MISQTPKPARYIRFIPVRHVNWIAMRVNIYVVEQVALRVQTATPSERSILLKWTLTCIKTRPRFIVNVIKKGEFNVGRVTSYNITGLQPYTDYEIQVKAVEYELCSQTMTIKTTVAVPEITPTIISNVTTSSTSIRLGWKLQELQLLHGPLTGYRITYTAQGGSTKTVDVGVVNTWTLTSLKKYTWYTITVSVKNTKYVGPPSRRLKIRTIREESSKTDQLREGAWISIARTDRPTCPVKAFEEYVAIAGIELDEELPLFRAIASNSCLAKVRRQGIGYSRVREIIKEAFKDITDMSKISLHRLRSGGATAVANAGIPDHLFKRHGRWSSENAKDAYVKDNLSSILSVSRSLGI